MPWRSRENRFAFVVAVTFITLSFLAAAAGQVMWNTRHINRSLELEAEMIEQRREMLLILRGLESRYLGVVPPVK